MTRLLVNAAWPRGPVMNRVAADVAAAGGDGVGVPDSPRLFADPFLATERLLAETDLALAGPCAIALGLRHPAAVASSLRTLAQRHGPRLVAVLARGESAVRNENLPVPSLRDYLSTVDFVVDGIGVERHGMTLLGSASGPRTLAATAARLDGVVIDVGVAPEVVAAAVARVRDVNPTARAWLFVRALAGADLAGVDLADVDRAVAPLLGSCAARLAAAPDWHQVPERLRAGVADLAAAHDYARHGTSSASDRIGASVDARAFVADRFFVVGDDDSVRSRIAALAAIGIDGIVISGAVDGVLDRLGPTVAAVRAGLEHRAEQA